jgi:hypothetical protein
MYIGSVDVLDKVQSDHSYMVLITCKKCGELDYLTSKGFSINRITFENGELRKQV